MLLAASENEIYVRQELDVGAQQCLCATFWIFGYLLKLIDGDIDSLARLLEIFEDVLQRFLTLVGRYRDGECRNASQLIKRHGGV